MYLARFIGVEITLMRISTPLLFGPRMRLVFSLTSLVCIFGIASAQEWPSEPKTVKGEKLVDRLEGAWSLPAGVAARNALRERDVPMARAELRRLAVQDTRLSDTDANECLLLIELMESRAVKDHEDDARSLAREALSRQSSNDTEAMFLRATALTDYLGDGQAALELYRRIVSGYTGSANLKTAASLTKAFEDASGREVEPTGYERRAYRRLLNVLALSESANVPEGGSLPSIIEDEPNGGNGGEGSGMDEFLEGTRPPTR